MNRTKTNEENEWRNASHPRLVERLDNQRKEITRLNAERDAAIARAEKAEAECLLRKEEYATAIRGAQDMVKRNAELQAIVSRLPKTADGVPFQNGMSLWRHAPQWYGGVKPEEVQAHAGLRGEYGHCSTSFENTYSTREAALAAQQPHPQTLPRGQAMTQTNRHQEVIEWLRNCPGTLSAKAAFFGISTTAANAIIRGRPISPGKNSQVRRTNLLNRMAERVKWEAPEVRRTNLLNRMAERVKWEAPDRPCPCNRWLSPAIRPLDYLQRTP